MSIRRSESKIRFKFLRTSTKKFARLDYRNEQEREGAEKAKKRRENAKFNNLNL